jgi:hypothetical protein
MATFLTENPFPPSTAVQGMISGIGISDPERPRDGPTLFKNNNMSQEQT